MDIEAKEYEIKMTHGELWTIAFYVKSSLIDSLKTHWVSHQNSWKQNELPRIEMLRNMFYALGRPDIFDEIEPAAKEIFKTYNDARK